MIRSSHPTRGRGRTRATDGCVHSRNCGRGLIGLPVVNRVNTRPEARRGKNRLVRVGFRFSIGRSL